MARAMGVDERGEADEHDNDNDREVLSTPIGEDNTVVAQENWAGKDNISGGGEFPDPHTPPSDSAPVGLVPHHEPGGGQFAEAYETEDQAAMSQRVPDEHRETRPPTS